MRTSKVFDHLGQKSDHIHYGYKIFQLKASQCQSIHNENIGYFLFSFDEVLEILLDVDDNYDDDNSLAKSVLSLLVRRGPRNAS